MSDAEDSIQTLRKQVIDTKDHLEHARYRLDALELIFEGLNDARVRGAAQEIFGLVKERLNAVDDGLDGIYRQLSGVERELGGEPG